MKIIINLTLLFFCTFSFAADVKIDRADALYAQQRFKAALHLYQMLAEKGNLQAQIQLAKMYIYGQSVPQSYEKAVALLKPATQKYYPEATFLYAKLLFNGLGVEKSQAKALQLFTEAAEANFIEAQNALGAIYLVDFGHGTDYKKAYYWNQKASKAGNAEAMYNFGQQYEKGAGVEKNLKKAIHWFQKAAKKGHAIAQFEMGYAYYYGIGGLNKNLDQSVHWYTKSAEQGNQFAQYNLAVIYVDGPVLVLPQDGMTKAEHAEKTKYSDKLIGIYWLSKAAKQGHKKASYLLSGYYNKGLYVPKNKSYELSLLRQAAKKGHETAKEKLDSLLEKIKEEGLNKNERSTAIKTATESDIELTNQFAVWQSKAKQNDLVALKELAFAYQYGLGVKRDTLKATDYYIQYFSRHIDQPLDDDDFIKLRDLYNSDKMIGDGLIVDRVTNAAKSGNTAMMRFMAQANCRLHGYNRHRFKYFDEINESLINWYRKAAEYNDPIAKLVIAKLNSAKGHDVKAAGIYIELTKSKNMDIAKYNLAKLYLDGQGVKKDPKKAVMLLTELQDHPYAQELLIRTYAAGGLGRQGYIKAEGSYLNLADKEKFYIGNQKLKEASSQLAKIYFNGLNGKKDYKKAYFWKALQAVLVSKDHLLFLGAGSVLSGCIGLESLDFKKHPFVPVNEESENQTLDLSAYKSTLKQKDINQVDAQVANWIEIHSLEEGEFHGEELHEAN